MATEVRIRIKTLQTKEELAETINKIRLVLPLDPEAVKALLKSVYSTWYYGKLIEIREEKVEETDRELVIDYIILASDREVDAITAEFGKYREGPLLFKLYA